MHATTADLEAWTGSTAPADADRLLRRASEFVDSRITTHYPTGPDGSPTDEVVHAALSEAVCAQVEFWTTGGGEADDVLGPAAASTVGPLKLTESWTDRLGPRAFDRLRRAGLLNASIPTGASL